MADEPTEAADVTAVRVAVWRALHVEVDPLPHVLEDKIGLQIAAPDDGWRRRRDMDRGATSRARAAIVARARHAVPAADGGSSMTPTDPDAWRRNEVPEQLGRRSSPTRSP